MDDDASTRSGWRALAASTTGFALVGVGLIGGLTPSHGCPGAGNTAVLGLAPILIVAFGSWTSRGPVRALLALQAVVTAGTVVTVLIRIGCLG